MVLKFLWASQPPGGLVTTQTTGSCYQRPSFWLSRPEVGPRIHVSEKSQVIPLLVVWGHTWRTTPLAVKKQISHTHVVWGITQTPLFPSPFGAHPSAAHHTCCSVHLFPAPPNTHRVLILYFCLRWLWIHGFNELTLILASCSFWTSHWPLTSLLTISLPLDYHPSIPFLV